MRSASVCRYRMMRRARDPYGTPTNPAGRRRLPLAGRARPPALPFRPGSARASRRQASVGQRALRPPRIDEAEPHLRPPCRAWRPRTTLRSSPASKAHPAFPFAPKELVHRTHRGLVRDQNLYDVIWSDVRPRFVIVDLGEEAIRKVIRIPTISFLTEVHGTTLPSRCHSQLETVLTRVHGILTKVHAFQWGQVADGSQCPRGAPPTRVPYFTHSNPNSLHCTIFADLRRCCGGQHVYRKLIHGLAAIFLQCRAKRCGALPGSGSVRGRSCSRRFPFVLLSGRVFRLNPSPPLSGRRFPQSTEAWLELHVRRTGGHGRYQDRALRRRLEGGTRRWCRSHSRRSPDRGIDKL